MTWLSRWFHPSASIITRLRIAYLLPILLIFGGSMAALQQFYEYEKQTQNKIWIDRQVMTLSSLRKGLLGFSDRAVQLLERRDLRTFAREIEALNQEVLQDINIAESVFRESPKSDENAATTGIFAMLRDSLQLRKDVLARLAQAGDKEAIQLRLEQQQKTMQEAVRRLIQQSEEASVRNQKDTLTRMRETRLQAMRIVMAMAIISLLVAVLLRFWLMRSIQSPLKELDEGAQRLAAGDFDYRIPVTGQDELSRLGEVLNYGALRLKELYASLQSSENHFRSLIENATDLILILSEEGEIRYASPSSAGILGWSPQELKGRPLLDLVEGNDRDRWRDLFGRGRPVPSRTDPLEISFRHAAGGIRHIEMLLMNQLDNPSVHGIVINARDISERVAAREKLETLNYIGRTVSTNLTLEEIFSLPTLQRIGAATGSDVVLAFLMENKRLVRKKESILPSAAPGQAVDPSALEKLFCTGFGEKSRPVYYLEDLPETVRYRQECRKLGIRALASLPLTAGEEVLGLIGLVSYSRQNYEEQRSFLEPMAGSISIGVKNALLFAQLQDHARELQEKLNEIERAEDSNRQLRRQLQQIQKMEAIGTLAGGIAHDFNNILSAILGYTELAMLEAPKESGSHTFLNHIFQAGNRARSLVKQILAFSRQSELEKRPIQVRGIAVEVLSFMRASLPATIEIRENLESTGTVLADPTMMYQVLLNLCTNAAQAMKEKGGTLTVEIKDVTVDPEFLKEHPDMKAGNYLRLLISDTGCGMSAQVLSRIFDPFFTTKKKGEGTGLGLSVVHGIVQSFEGNILVYSEPGQGSAFHIFLPALKSAACDSAEPEKRMPTGSERVLFVDDEKSILDLNETFLHSLGYTVTVCQYPLQALEMMQSDPHRFDIVITDLTMPKMTGLQLAGKIFAIRQDIPILLSTGFSSPVDEQTAQAMGIKAVIQKPILIRELADKIRTVLSA